MKASKNLTFMISLQLMSMLAVSVKSAKKTLNPHDSGPHCWDVSIYEDVYHIKKDREKCSTEFPKITVPKKTKVSK